MKNFAKRVINTGYRNTWMRQTQMRETCKVREIRKTNQLCGTFTLLFSPAEKKCFHKRISLSLQRRFGSLLNKSQSLQYWNNLCILRDLYAARKKGH